MKNLDENFKEQVWLIAVIYQFEQEFVYIMSKVSVFKK